jgi:inosine/xanthosine triphosphatase
MVINVGSTNQTKVAAVKNLLAGHKLFPNATVKAVEVSVDEFGHPKTLADTIEGAKQRAKLAFSSCDYCIGIESGLIEESAAKSGYFETTVCAIYDGKNYHLGLSPSFEWPKQMVELILNGYDGSQAFKQIGLTSQPKIGTAEGGIYILTHGKINRTKLNELAITMALIHLENPSHYLSK